MSDRYRVALLGNGIGQSLSPALHMREARHLGLDYEYRTVDLIDRPDVDLGAELRRLEDAGFDAANVTYPFKQSVLEHVDGLSPTVRRLGSANLVLLRDGHRTAHNTDCTGFRAALEDFLAGRLPRQATTSPGDHLGSVLQIGAGGAGLATASALIDMGFDPIIVHDVVPEAVEALLRRFSSPDRLRSSGGSLDAWLPQVDGVVHVTPVGMAEHPGVAFDVGRLGPDAWVAEVVYRPLETELVRRARARGLATLDGGGMAVGQAVESLRLITGLEPDVARMHAHFNQLVTGGPTTGEG
ncbi:shikimate dehydrogenase [Promicromonospora panici]|uniref:shikimate dehydrogenase n=1 Tax=Promicromonospora panici TaxID=2219658 RepID=UPI00101D555B|nr:shikimate dehydrogenase [Promicromonospora panici]